ncbi:MAG: prohibitin family protein, partial [Clostridia bacterium]|nr:prohibitin family protein [Clostridia bacterium]
MDNRKKRNPRTKLIVPVVILVVILLAIIAFPPFVSVPTGHTGVVTTFGRVEDKVLDEGFHFKNPVQHVVMMDNRTQKASMAMQAFSSDIQQVDIVCSVNYSVDKQNAQNLYKNVGVNYYETIMRPRVQECTKSVFTKYTAETLMDVRSSLSTQIRDLLAPEMKDYGILIASVTVENVDFTDAFTDAVEAKQVALQTKLKTETQQAELVSIAQSTAERDLIAARTDAEKRTILAEA